MIDVSPLSEKQRDAVRAAAAAVVQLHANCMPLRRKRYNRPMKADDVVSPVQSESNKVSMVETTTSGFVNEALLPLLGLTRKIGGKSHPRDCKGQSNADDDEMESQLPTIGDRDGWGIREYERKRAADEKREARDLAAAIAAEENNEDGSETGKRSRLRRRAIIIDAHLLRRTCKPTLADIGYRYMPRHPDVAATAGTHYKSHHKFRHFGGMTFKRRNDAALSYRLETQVPISEITTADEAREARDLAIETRKRRDWLVTNCSAGTVGHGDVLRKNLRAGSEASRIANARRFFEWRQSVGDPDYELQGSDHLGAGHADFDDFRALFTWRRMMNPDGDALQTNWRIVPRDGEAGLLADLEDETVDDDGGFGEQHEVLRDRRWKVRPSTEKELIRQWRARGLSRGKPSIIKLGEKTREVPGALLRKGGLRFSGIHYSRGDLPPMTIGALTHYDAHDGRNGFRVVDEYAALRGADEQDTRSKRRRDEAEHRASSIMFILSAYTAEEPGFEERLAEYRKRNSERQDGDPYFRLQIVRRTYATQLDYITGGKRRQPCAWWKTWLKPKRRMRPAHTRKLVARIVRDMDRPIPTVYPPGVAMGSQSPDVLFIGRLSHGKGSKGSVAQHNPVEAARYTARVLAATSDADKLVLNAALKARTFEDIGRVLGYDKERTARDKGKEALRRACRRLDSTLRDEKRKSLPNF